MSDSSCVIRCHSGLHCIVRRALQPRATTSLLRAMMRTSAHCVASTSTTHVLMTIDGDHPSIRSHSTRQPSAQHNQRPIKSELTSSPDSRLLDLSPPLSSRPIPLSRTYPEVAIQPYQTRNTPLNSLSQDVPCFVNNSAPYLSSPGNSSDAFSHYLGPSVPNLSPSNHVLTHRRQRPRTSNLVFTTSHGSIAARDIPKNLPPAPSTAPRRTSEPEPLSDFLSMQANYLNMLKQKSDDTAVTDADTATVSPLDLQAPVMDSYNYQEIVDILKQGISASSTNLTHPPHHASTAGMQHPVPPTPDLTSSPDFNDLGDDFLITSPDADFLTTPLINEDDVLTGMFDDEGGCLLFPPIDYSSSIFSQEPLEKSQPSPALPDLHSLYTMTPESPALHDFSPSVNPASLYLSPNMLTSTFPSPALTSVPPTPVIPAMPSSSSRRPSGATGTRKGVTPEALVPIDAPTQARKYVTPSATSRKEIPSVFAKKRARSVAFGPDDDDQDGGLEPLGPNPTERELIEYKRRQNTVAARRSRKRKLEYQQHLEEQVRTLDEQRVRWQERVAICQEMMRSHGIVPPVFDEEGEEF